jgi:hypothetical protein
VNEFLLPQLKISETISISTSVRWLKKLGFSMRRVVKGIYVDGHERPDVVEARKQFINYMYHSVLPLVRLFIYLNFLTQSTVSATHTTT